MKLSTKIGRVALVIATVLFLLSFLLTPTVFGGITAIFFVVTCVFEFFINKE
jgi:hypothetical protein